MCTTVPLLTVMAVRISEYLGQEVRADGPVLEPAKPGALCPFSGNPCSKVNRSKPLKPVCIVTSRAGKAWIVCKDRLCATSGRSIGEYQKDVLLKICSEVAQRQLLPADVIFKREVPVAVPDASDYHADYVVAIDPCKKGSIRAVLEMQGGGETSTTGKITVAVQNWEDAGDARTNSMLMVEVGASTIETNAWRRQQEQFFVKGRVAVRSNGKLVFCVGELIMDYLQSKISASPPVDLRNGNWTLALICVKVVPSSGDGPSMELQIDRRRTLFTDYEAFVRAITSVGGVDPSLFSPPYLTMNGETWVSEDPI